MARWFWRVALAFGGLLGSYVGMSCLLFVLGTHRASLSQQAELWQPFPLPQPSERILIVAPHPDDEVLGCGGLIAQAVRRGALVRVVFLTCGDGYVGAATLLCRSTPRANDFINLGKLRMQEARRAAQALGLDPQSLIFLGYPDRHLWQMALAGNQPVRAPTTQRTRVPYTEAFRPGAPYSALALVDDLRRVLTDFQPTQIFVTHPLDDHPDHMVASLYIREAVAQSAERGELLLSPQMFYYLVHRGDWPLPQGDYPNRALVPPPGMTDPPWLRLPLDSELLTLKRRALYAHESQYALMARFLSSFLRANELFVPAFPCPSFAQATRPPALIPPSPFSHEEKGESNQQLPSAFGRRAGREGLSINPIDDNPVLRLRPGADLQQLEVEPTIEGLSLRVETRQPLTAPLRLHITLILIANDEWRVRTWLYVPERARAFDGRVEAHGSRLQFWLPVPELSRAKRAYLLVQSRLYRIELDRSGLCAIPLSPPGGHAVVAGDAPSRSTGWLSVP